MQNTQTIFALLPLVMTLLAAGQFADKNASEHYVSPWKTPWTYAGADHWSELDPTYAACNTGKEQSPIDIADTQKAELPPLRFEYKSAPLKYVVNNGHTIRVNYQGENGNFLFFGDQRYQLTQFHFHHPSEEYIHGKPYDMVVHLMYQASDGHVAAVAVLLQAGRPNPTIQQIWEHMPATEGQNEVDGVELNPAGLLPQTSREPLAYYTYAGSQTAPPCTEGVTWFVLKNPLEISADQISAFARLYPSDVRPVQALNGRVVKQNW